MSGTVTETGSGNRLAGTWLAVLRQSDFTIAAGAVADNGSLTDVKVTVSQTSTEVVTVVSGRAVTVLWPRRVESTVMVPRERLTGS